MGRMLRQRMLKTRLKRPNRLDVRQGLGLLVSLKSALLVRLSGPNIQKDRVKEIGSLVDLSANDHKGQRISNADQDHGGDGQDGLVDLRVIFGLFKREWNHHVAGHYQILHSCSIIFSTYPKSDSVDAIAAGNCHADRTVSVSRVAGCTGSCDTQSS